MTFVKVKLKLETLSAGDRLSIRMSGGETAENMPRSLREDGYRTLSLAADGDAFVLIAEK
ncbi:MAG: sulfurtransferase TusA family protein [Magnetococcus sp. MYC-9]